MNTVMEDLKQALCDTMTKTVVKEAVYNTSNMVYYDDFLGNGDQDKDGKPVKYGEDRLFTTSMAINALITTWTYYNDVTGHLHWDENTPADVKKVVAASVNFLNTYILGDEYKPWNMFFSGSFKGFGTSGRSILQTVMATSMEPKSTSGEWRAWPPSLGMMDSSSN
uniref:Uncharacterized protein LOC111136844 n=1 Tax=Crassostrea virginica TaxID=6565 RepID=A0A8B8EUN9_CRAVI|nr:uncharacterized protein LOC111136844 [Crassostrea virginica]